MYEEIFNQIRSAANKRNLKDSTIHAYCTSVAHFLNHTAKDIDALTTDDVDIFLTEKKLSGISPETYNHYHSGIRFFYKKILKKNCAGVPAMAGSAHPLDGCLDCSL